MTMPSPALLQAISRLDQAVVKAEARCDALLASSQLDRNSRDKKVRAAMTEIEEVMALLNAGAEKGENAHG
jgi:hypothetical protein